MLMKQWITSFIRNSIIDNPAAHFWGRIIYYYMIMMGLFVLYFVQKQHTPAPYIYNNF